MQYIDCYINPITRLVTYPANTTIVQKDTNVEVLRFHFTLEAEHDLENDSIRVMVLKGGETIGFNAENVRIETNDGGDEELVFEHTITTHETAEPGQIAVSICGNQVSGNVISEAWHTLNMNFQVSGAAHSDSDEGEDTPETAASNAEKIAALQTLVNAVTSGRPIPVDLKSKMVDTDAIYLYTGNETGEQTNYWYYHNGTSWVAGAEYGSMTIDDTLSVTGAAADAKATGDALDELNERLDELEQSGGSGAGIPTVVRQALYRLFNNTAFGSNAGFTSDVAVLQSWASEITEISISQSSISISGVTTSQLTAVTVPAGGLVTWTSSNPSVATVSNNGLVTSVGNGTAKITASCGDKKAVCNVTVSDIVQTYSITNSLSNCSNSNNAASIISGNSYTGTVTANSGYYVDDTDITVTMGGVDITSSCLSNGVISIPAVTGNVVITATAIHALYPMKNGVHTFSNGTTCTITNHSHVVMNISNGNDANSGFCNLSDLTENSSNYNSADDNVKNKSSKFTIPANSTAVLTISNLTRSNNKVVTFNLYGTGAANLGMGLQDITSDSTATKTFAEDADCGCIFFVGRYSQVVEFDVNLTVDGVRYC